MSASYAASAPVNAHSSLLLSQHCAQTFPDLLLGISADLKPSLFELGTKSLDVGLHPQRDECLTVTHPPAIFPIEQEPAGSKVVHAPGKRAQGDIGFNGQSTVGRVFSSRNVSVWPSPSFNPALLRTTRGRRRFFARLAALHVNEQARRLQMWVAGEVEVIDLCAFKDGCLLNSDVEARGAGAYRRRDRPATPLCVDSIARLRLRHPDDGDAAFPRQEVSEKDGRPGVFQVTMPSKRAKAFPGIRISAFGIHL